jgi:hypothetical protein
MIIGKSFLPPVIPTGITKTFNVFGKSFFKIRGVFLSGGVFENETFFNPFSASQRLSADYPGFYGISLSATQYASNNKNELVFTMPSAAYEGFADVILMNEAGWGKLTSFVIKNTINPYVSGTVAYDTYEPYQRPWRDGIVVGTEIPLTVTPELPVSFILSLTADDDFDGYSNVAELSAGTDPNDSNDFPSSLFGVFNNI